MATPEPTTGALPSADDTTIDVVLPTRADLAATLRVVVASLGADVGLTVDEIDDVRLAVNEVFASTADHDVPTRFAASFTPSDDSLSITMRTVEGEPLVLDHLATTILGSVVDGLQVTDHVVTIEKRAHEARS